METKKQDVAACVMGAMKKKERSMQWTAQKAGFSTSTFRRKALGEGEFKVSELARIAKALSVPPWSLLPEEFAKKDATELSLASGRGVA